MSEQIIKTTRGDRVADVEGQFDPDDFYKTHRGGAGNVVVVFVYRNGAEDRIAIFGSIERAQEWSYGLGEDCQCVLSPHVVDAPEFGNVVAN